MAARLTRLLSPLCSTSRSLSTAVSAISPPLPFLPHRALISGRHGLSMNCGQSWIQTDSLIGSLLPFGLMKRKMFSQGLKLSGKKLLQSLPGSLVGFTIVNAMVNHQLCTTYALDDDQADLGAPSGYLKDELHTIWSFMRKFQLPAVLFMTVFLGWRHPLTLVINVGLLLFSTRPNPFSVYMFIEQLHHRDLDRSTRWSRSKFVYKNIKIEDYKFLCFATVEQRDTKLYLLGILGGWWIVHTSKI